MATAAVIAIVSGCNTAAVDGTPTIEWQAETGLRPLTPAPGTFHVLLFVTTDCPIANSYAPEIRSIAGEHADDPVRFFLVHVDPEVTVELAREHARDYGHELPILLDPDQELVRVVGATVTPEAALLDDSGELLYLGRIDDLYADLGRKRRFPRDRDLRAALTAVLEGRDVAAPRTRAVGCLMPDPL